MNIFQLQFSLILFTMADMLFSIYFIQFHFIVSPFSVFMYSYFLYTSNFDTATEESFFLYFISLICTKTTSRSRTTIYKLANLIIVLIRIVSLRQSQQQQNRKQNSNKFRYTVFFSECFGSITIEGIMVIRCY